MLRETGHELNDVGRTLSWGALDSFLKHIAPDSALMRELNPDAAVWSSTTKTNAILADIWDMLATINSNLIAIGSGRPAKKPKLYPRPKQHDHDSERHFGSKALPVEELHKWIEQKRAEHARSSTGDHNRHTGS